MKEDKAKIAKAIYQFLKATSHGINILDVTYSKDGYDEYVTVEYASGTIRRVNVACDSGVAMMMDVLREVV